MAVEKKSKKKDELLNKNVIIIDPVMKEESNSKIVISFGRMNPPTRGHEKLINKVKDIARKEGAKAEVYLSHTQDAKKNPLSYDDKVMLAREAFGSIVQKINLKTIIDVMKHLSGKYAEVILVVGQDRVGEFETLLNKYNGKDYNFSSIKVASAGERDPDAEGVEGMSASKMREAAKDGDEAKFKSGLPKKLQMHADDIYTMVRAGMKLAESTEDLKEYVLSIDQRRKRALVMRRYETKMKMARERLKQRIASNQKLIGRSRKKAIDIIRKMVAGEKGLNYHDLSVSDKMAIDKRVEQRKGAIGKIAARLLPKVRQAEMKRVQLLHKTNESFEQLIEGDSYHTGLSPSTVAKRKAHFAKGAAMDDNNPAAYKPAPGDARAKTKLSTHTRRYHMMYNGNGDLKYDRRFRAFKHIVRNEEYESDSDLLNMIEEVWDLAAQINESTVLDESKSMQGLKDKAEKSGMPYGVLKKVFDRGVAAWRTGHRPGTTPQQWGYARVNSFITKSSGTWGKADADLASKVRSESINESFEEFINEGVNDPSIFKAVFLAGGPGSGKSFIVGKTALTALGFKVINSDDIFERALTKAGLKTTPEVIYSPRGQEIRGQAKELTGKKLDLALNGRLGLVIDGTGKDYEKIEKQAGKLKKLGYEVAMIFVNTDLDTAKDRNRARARSLPDDEVETMWKGVQKNIGKFQNFFGAKMFVIDNSAGANFEGAITSTYRKISTWAKITPTNPEAKSWIASQRNISEDKKSFRHHLGIGVPLKHVGKDALTHQDTDLDGDVDQDDFNKTVPDETSADRDVTKKFLKKYGDEKKHTRKGVAFESYHVPHNVSAILVPDPEADEKDDAEMSAYSRGRLKGSIARAGKLKKFRFHEAYGAGFEGTDDLVQNFKAATPGEKGSPKKPKITDGIKINEAFESMSVLANWDNSEPANYVKHLIKFLGTPEELTTKRAVWYNKDGFKRIEVLDEFILHSSPSPHYDYVYSYVDLKVPHDLADDLAKSSESILIDHLKGEVGGRCASLSANAVTIQYVIDVVEGNTTPSKAEYEQRIKAMKKMFEAGKRFRLDWWPDVTNDTDPKNPYYAEDINEAFESLMEAEAEEVEITASKMKDFEKFVDRMFEKFKIDFEFTKHFGERMNDERNSPKIKLKELADLIKKIYNKNGNPLKGKAGAELVVKDLQSDLNMPIVVKYDEKNDEIDIVAKTIMRKKNFSTPNPVIKY